MKHPDGKESCTRSFLKARQIHDIKNTDGEKTETFQKTGEVVADLPEREVGKSEQIKVNNLVIPHKKEVVKEMAGSQKLVELRNRMKTEKLRVLRYLGTKKNSKMLKSS